MRWEMSPLAGRDEFSTNERRTANHSALRRELEEALSSKSVAEWLGILQQAGVPCAPINNLEQVVNDAHINARNMIIDSVDELGNRVQHGGESCQGFGV